LHVYIEAAGNHITDKPEKGEPDKQHQVPLFMCQPAIAGQRVLLIRGLMDYLPGISPMSSLQAAGSRA
jgi:hypothetical protein